MSRQVELKWNCGECSTEGILGRHKKCPSCGSPREKGEMKMDGLGSDDYDSRTGRNKAATVTDPELLKLASAGADWFCSHCGSGNMGAKGTKCSSCSASRYGTAEEDHPDFEGDHKKVQVEMWTCSQCKGANNIDDTACSNCGNVRFEPSNPDEEPTPRSTRRDKVAETWARVQAEAPKEEDPWVERARAEQTSRQRMLILAGVGGAVLLTLFVAFMVWASQTHTAIGTVTGSSWNQSVVVQQWTDITERHWAHQTSETREVPPVRGAGERAGMEKLASTCRQEHFADERYVCGSHQECEDIYRTERESYDCTKSERYVCGETCRDNGNGFATCSDKYCTRQVPDTCTRSVKVFDHKSCHDVDDYCSRPILKSKCDYRTQEWRTARTVPASGSGEMTRWAEVAPTELQRLRYSGDYSVTITYADRGSNEVYTFDPTADTTETMLGSTAVISLGEAQSAERLYRTWAKAGAVTLSINNLGGVADAKVGNTVQVEALTR